MSDRLPCTCTASTDCASCVAWEWATTRPHERLRVRCCDQIWYVARSRTATLPCCQRPLWFREKEVCDAQALE